ncbi:hypothetical protein FBZ89_12150 [Nitrospirillum amazonense]|uniref:Uncharacterized protein n=1 Tax=Nitrospirillum amazonense TaxID=28077 RepID=A0A560EUM3_9PROT|nr:hypothetical protein [Nitrospirillum amazonense]TWB13083.1 hypothetical protein FBZ89_12150 [Nitrospirillum amazonense]
MTFPVDKIVVTEIAGKRAVAKASTGPQQQALLNLGFAQATTEFVRPIASNDDRIELVNALITIGALFSGGRDWSPEELVAYYKDNGHVKQSYQTINWRSKNEYIIRQA